MLPPDSPTSSPSLPHVANALLATYPEYVHERGLAGLRDEQHAEVPEEASVELVSASAGRGAGGAHHDVVKLLPEELLTVVQAAEVQQLSVGTQGRNMLRAKRNC